VGVGTSKNQEGTQGNIGAERADNKTARKHKAGRKQKPQAPEPVAADLIKVLLDHFFPDFNEKLGNIPEPRCPERIIYSKEHLLHLGLSMFLCQHGSRSQLESERRTVSFFHNLLALSNTDENHVATAETMSYFMEMMDPADSLELLPGEMTKRLIHSRVLDKYRNSDGEFMVAVDGVHLHTKKGRHPNAVYKKIGGKTSSYYYALEAKLVTSDGMGFSLATVFIENEEEYVKQDCELKAFYRLAEVLKERFPRLRIRLLLDGLYPNKHVLKICEKNQWGYFITLKDKCLPSVHEMANWRFEDYPGHSVDYSPEKGVYQHLSWALNMKHEGQQCHLLKCEEIRVTPEGIEKTTFVWLTDSRPNKKNAAKLAKEARCRWKIEEMFNIQKNGGYRLAHNYGTIGFAMKNYYYLLQIAHLLHQLMVRSDLFPKLQKKFIMRKFAELPHLVKTYLAVVAENTLKHFRTIKNFVRRLAESFRNQMFSELATNPEILGKIQIRLDSS
jgi:hypothetical protein